MSASPSCSPLERNALLVCKRCGHPEEVHPQHGACVFHTCDCPRFESSAHVPRPR